MAAAVRFDVTHQFAAPTRRVWDELVDWKAHEAWIPATKVEIHTDGDPAAIGAEFTATTGYGPLAMPDRMRVTRCAWDEGNGTGDCEVVWIEDVTVRRVPSFLAPIAKVIGAAGFKLGMRKLAKQLAS